MTGRQPADPGPVLVRDALAAMRFSTAQVHGLVAHIAEGNRDAASLTLGEHPLISKLMDLDPPILSLECLRTTAPGVALEIVTYLRKEYGPRAQDVRMRRPAADDWQTSFEVQRVPDPDEDETVTFEYLLEIPDRADAGPDERPTVGRAALLVIEFVAPHKFNVAFVHAPASPPAPRGIPCRPHGPCARVGVEVPRARAHEMLGLGEALVRRVSDAGLHLWVRDTETPDAAYDAWRRMYPTTVRPERTDLTTPGVLDPGQAGRLAITCIGPARRDASARLAERFAAANTRVRAVSAVKLDELTVAHGVLDIDSLHPRPTSSGAGTLDELLQGSAGSDLSGFRAFWSLIDPPPPAAEKAVLWMKWAIRTPNELSPQVVASAWNAVRRSCARWAERGPYPRPHMDYVISRVRTGGWLRGRAKVALDLEAIKEHWPEGKENGHWLRRFCAEVEDRWRSDIQTSLCPPRADLVVGWSESWLAARPSLRR
jgi:hypothetical protein